MASFSAFLGKVDQFQQKTKLVSFLVAVLKKYGDDQAGTQAALLTYYGFVSLFPLLLVFFTILGVFVRHYPSVENTITNSVLHYFPIAATQLKQNIHGLHHSNALGTIIELLIILYGARGIASALQNTCGKLWSVPKLERPGFPTSLLRSLGIVIFGGIGIVLTSAILSYATSIAHGERILRLVVILATFVLNFIVYMLVFRLATPPSVKTSNIITGAVVAAIFWQLLQLFGSYLVLHQFRTASTFYGIFALVLGLLFWLYLQAQMTLYALEIDVVKTKKLWPKKLFS